MIYNFITALILLGLFCLSYIIVSLLTALYFKKYKDNNKSTSKIIWTFFLKALLAIPVFILLVSTFTYPKVVETENTLKNSVNVKTIVGLDIYLEDGRVIRCTTEKYKLDYAIKRSHNRIELIDCGTPPDGHSFEIYINSPGGLCGNEFGWIPLIPIPRKLKAYRSRFTFGEVINK